MTLNAKALEAATVAVHFAADDEDGTLAEAAVAAYLEAVASTTSAGVTEEQTGTFADGVKAAARFVRQRLDDYVSEHGMYDPETGATEFPGNGDETVCEWEEIIEGLESLKEIKP